MKRYGDHGYRADKGKHFVLTEKGQREVASYRNYEVGKPIDFGYSSDDYAYIPDVENGYIEEVNDPDYIVAIGWKTVYTHNGHQISCGNPKVFHDKGMAERMKNNWESRIWNKGETAEIIPAIYEGKCPKPCKTYNGKPVYNEDWWWGEIGIPGDYVEEEIADWIANCVPPKTYRSNLIQCGEPSSSRFDDNLGKYRTTYSTFRRIAEDVWQYCGNCFAGETEERGAEPIYVAS